MPLFHLEDNVMEATSLAEIAGVYWCARDMDPFFAGNHHFITFVYENEAQARRITRQWGSWDVGYHSDKNDQNLTIFFTTMGVSRDGNKKIRISFNPSSDLQAIHEILKDSNTSWNSADYDFEGHRMPLDQANPAYSSHEKLMVAVLENVLKFQKIYQQGMTIDYSLVDENCAAGVNTIFKHCGFPSSVRETQGEFSGTDWGEEDEIPSSFFDLTYQGNTHTKEIHIPQCTWVRKIDATHKIQFESASDAIAQGYNGCAFCLNEIDTDSTPAASTTRFTLHLLSLACHETEDFTGADSAFIKINGAIVWGPEQINNNEVRNLSEATAIQFTTSIRLDLYDQDTGLFVDSDDHIGGIDIPSSQAGAGNQEASINGDGARYTITYRVEQA